ncbi:PspC domain-containing protein [Novosphingobium sp. FSY-8]|uniref:PspC domain-containing protein n=1 Tax=Novosphingobium ovatum TaxID=1908523 RepID=A0ABW9XEF7_9SPHN|nr:PspC domain-containing protein [Novosphingobium ovatum]NBC36911.1 PspC domain-containing protein [Novosphingobium ovatum]
MNTDPYRPGQSGFRLDKTRGKLFGVCAGLARYFNIDVLWVRLAFVLGTVFVFGALAVVYIAIALLAD